MYSDQDLRFLRGRGGVSGIASTSMISTSAGWTERRTSGAGAGVSDLSLAFLRGAGAGVSDLALTDDLRRFFLALESDAADPLSESAAVSSASTTEQSSTSTPAPRRTSIQTCVDQRAPTLRRRTFCVSDSRSPGPLTSIKRTP